MSDPEKPAAPAPSAASYVAWGILMLAAAAAWASTASYEGPFLALGCLLFGLASFLAGWANKKGRTGAALLIVAAGLGACVVNGARGAAGGGWFMGKGHEEQTLGRLGSLRSALSIYYGDLEGSYPPSLESLTVNGKYLAEIPLAQVPGAHPPSGAVVLGKSPDDSGGWLYNNDPLDADAGTVRINCTHTDGNGKEWASY